MMGPPVTEPRPPSSTKTATARSSCSAITHEWVRGGSSSPNSAVPVLPIAVSGSSPCSTPRCPDETTARIMVRSCSASSAVRGSSGPDPVAAPSSSRPSVLTSRGVTMISSSVSPFW